MSSTSAPDRLSQQQITGKVLKRLRRRAELTQEEAAAKADVVVQSWRRYEAGDRDLSIDKIRQLVSAIGFDLEMFLRERNAVMGGEAEPEADTFGPGNAGREHAVEAMMPVRERLQAGAFLAADDTIQVLKSYPEIRDPRFPRARQWLSQVVGDSVDQLHIFDGDFVKVVDAIDIDYSPRTGDIVEVERRRFQGREREYTIKQIEVAPGGMLLWPRSSNPRWAQPLDIRPDAEGRDETEEVIIRGLILKAIRPLF